MTLLSMDHPHHLLAKHCSTLIINLVKSLSLHPFWDSSLRGMKSKVTSTVQKSVLVEAARVEVGNLLLPLFNLLELLVVEEVSTVLGERRSLANPESVIFNRGAGKSSQVTDRHL